MQISSLIRSRRSIRRFKHNTISSKDLSSIIEAARWAPSGLNNQPWRFIIIKDRDSSKKISEFTKYASIVREAAINIVVCLKISCSYDREKDLMAVGACIQNMLLQAHRLGIGSCWIGEILRRKKELSRSLDINKDLEIMAVVSFGYPKVKAKKAVRLNSKRLVVAIK